MCWAGVASAEMSAAGLSRSLRSSINRLPPPWSSLVDEAFDDEDEEDEEDDDDDGETEEPHTKNC